jgi:hypothetical protein
MTSQVLFDRLAYVDRLKAASFTEQQARGAADALGEALTETVATKSDLKDLRSELQAEMKTGFAQVDARFAQVATQIAESKAALIQWIVGVAIATCTVGAAVAGFVIKHVP